MTIVAKNSLTLSNVNDGTITHYAYANSADGTDGFYISGGVNLLTGTSSDLIVDDSSNTNLGWKYATVYNNLIAGYVYTFSSEVSVLGSATSIDVRPYNPKTGSTITGSYTTFSIVDGKISGLVKPTDGYTQLLIYAGNQGNTHGNKVTFHHMKLEQGDKDTSWSPAPSEAHPSYIGQYTDFSSTASTDPAKYAPWIIFKGSDGKDGVNGKDGIAGKDGVGIQTTTITYAQSTDGTTAPTTGWTTSVPSLVKGQYLWTKTVWTYTDNSSETGYSVTYISKDGNNGTDGIAGKDGVGLTSTSITYVGSTSGTTVPTTGWTPSVPSVPAGQFLWTKTVWRYSDNTSETGYSVAMMGPKGDKGDTGANGAAGKDGNGIKTTVISYAISTSGTTTPTSGWTTQVPALIKGQYLWTKTVWTYTDNTNGIGYSVTYISIDGNNGKDGIAGKDGVGIKTTTITYVGSTSGTTTPTSGWTSTIPTVAAGSYLWTKTVWTYTDNTSETGYSVAKMGNTGPTGPAGAPGSTGAPGKVVSNTEPISLFTGLTWKYSGTTDLTARDGTTILAGTEYYWNGSKWTLYEINAHNINGNNLKITDGEFLSTTTNGSVITSTEIKDNHIAISKTDGTVNTRNDIALDSEQGLAQKFTNNSTGFYRTAGINYQGPFTSDSDGNYAQLTPQGTKLSTDVPWTILSPLGGFSGGLIRFAVKNGVAHFSLAGLSCPPMTAGNWIKCAQLPSDSIAIPSENQVTAAFTNATVWGFYVSKSGGLYLQSTANSPALKGFVNASNSFPIG